MFRKPVGGPRIVPFGQPRLKSDVLYNGHPAFRVTQRFGDYDAIFKTRIHGAMDVGNFYCGDSVYAMAAGIAHRLRDPNGARGVAIFHSNGYRTEYWHLSTYAIAHGASARSGQRIGKVGSSGLNIGGCHLHVVVYDPSGRQVDPWPLLDQNQ